LLDVLVEDPIDRAEDLGLADEAATAADEILQDAALAARQEHDLALDDRIAAIREHPYIADIDIARIIFAAAADGLDSRHDLAHMHRLAHDIIDAGSKDLERVLEPRILIQRDDRRLRAAADLLGIVLAIDTVAEDEAFHRFEIDRSRGAHPIVEIRRRK